ncbi:UNVERIFIED_CONTAM: hypothetical protein PYX00_011248 [Menopon gallinae]|uniref:T-complex protein 1 subunit alpha n=1 Tax=Menopon gallinae TaxID=328185 RepID=A0AAW2H6D5_9NEOP
MHGQMVRDMHEQAVGTVAACVSTSFGPLGLDKMCVDNVGEVMITNDGATILKSIDVDEPASRMMVDLAKEQDREVGDGTTSVVLLASSLVEKGNQVIRKGVHSSVLISGYKMAFKESVNFIKGHLQVETSKLSQQTLKGIVETSISSKVIKSEAEHFSKMTIDALKAIEDEKPAYNIKTINVLKKQGGSMKDSFLVNGYALNCTPASGQMPRRIKNPKIVCLGFSLQKTKMHLGVSVVVDNPDALEEIRLKEIEITKEKVSKILGTGANLVLTSGGIDDICTKQFLNAGAIAVKRVKDDELKTIASAVGTSVLNSLSNLDGEDHVGSMGHADFVSIEQVGDSDIIIIGGAKKKMASIVLRGANEQLLDEMERSVHDALCALKRAMESKTIVSGGGSVETALSLHLDHFANTICSKDQVGIQKFSEALLAIPKALAVNAGLDSNEIVAKLLSFMNRNKDIHGYKLGIDASRGTIQDNIKLGIIEPAMSKLKALRSATEAAIAILRIDEVIKLPPETKS